jgi:hypothetical protein
MSVRLLIAFAIGAALARVADALDTPYRECARLLRRLQP